MTEEQKRYKDLYEEYQGKIKELDAEYAIDNNSYTVGQLFRDHIGGIFLTIICFLIVSCHQSPGAICRDGHRSYSTGRGTCSWHGGVAHYVDTKEISVPKTAGLIAFLGFVGLVVFGGGKSKTNNK
jgi:hypothetical protein